MDDAMILPYSVHLADLEKVLRRSGVEVSLKDTPSPAQRDDADKSGRPRKYAWADMKGELLERIDQDGAFVSQAAAEKWAAVWFRDFGKGSMEERMPSESEIRKHVKELLDIREAQLKWRQKAEK